MLKIKDFSTWQSIQQDRCSVADPSVAADQAHDYLLMSFRVNMKKGAVSRRLLIF